MIPDILLKSQEFSKIKKIWKRQGIWLVGSNHLQLHGEKRLSEQAATYRKTTFIILRLPLGE